MDTSKEEIKAILMNRDGMEEYDAQDLIDDAQAEITELIMSGCEGMDGLSQVEDIIQDYFGLEPDYVMAFI